MTRRALLSVSNKSGLVPLAQALVRHGYELVSTGGTFRALQDAGVAVRYVTEVTGQPEVFGGRVKTLHPRVHGGILYRRDLAEHVEQAAAQDIAPIDVVVVNLYPFEATVQNPSVTREDAIEQIDIGGPAMVRAAAKNADAVTIIVRPADYDDVIAELDAHGGSTTAATRRRLATAAFEHTADYDAAIARWMGGADALPQRLPLNLTKVEDLRYGENPHQQAALYTERGVLPFGGARFLHGKSLSYNNIIDLDGAVACVLEFEQPAAVVVKHTNPCGVGTHPTSSFEAWKSALAADPVSAFGGIVAVNRTVDVDVARGLNELFLEVVAAPGYDADALAVLQSKKNLRVIELPATFGLPARAVRQTLFGYVAQTYDPLLRDLDEGWDVVTERAPTDEQRAALRFLWAVCKHVKSNAIVIGDAARTFGVGAGQMSRVDSVKLAIAKATGPVVGAALASDAFFPFRDGVDAAADAGVTAIIQPGGSKRDDEVIAACNERGIAMVFTGNRHFRH